MPRDSSDPRFFIPLSVEGKIYQALLDTGSTSTFIGDTLRQELVSLGTPTTSSDCPIHLADGEEIITTEHYQITLRFGETIVTGEVTYFPGLNEDALFGMDLLGKLDMQISIQGYVIKTKKNDSDEDIQPIPTIISPKGAKRTNPTQSPQISSSSSSEKSSVRFHGNPKAKIPIPEDPFKGITLKGNKHQHMFLIRRPFGNISVRLNKKKTEASLKFRGFSKVIQITP